MPAAFLFSQHCAPAPPGAQSAAAAARPELSSTPDRGAGPLSDHAIVDPEGHWHATIQARRPPRVKAMSGEVLVEADLGTTSSLFCRVQAGPIDAATALASLFGSFDGKFVRQQAGISRVAAAREMPVIFASARYAPHAAQQVSLQLNVAVSPGDALAFYCLQEGSADAFMRSVETFASSLEGDEAPVAAQYSAIWQSNLGDIPCGFSWDRIYAKADGTMLKVTLDSQFAQLPSHELAAGDKGEVTVHDRSGILRGNFVESRGGKKAYGLALERAENNDYTYAGEAEGKPLSGRFSTRAALGGYYELLLQLQRGRAADHPLQFHQEEYLPDRSLTAPAGVDYELDPLRGVLQSNDGQGAETTDLKEGLPARTRFSLWNQPVTSTALSQRSSLGTLPGFTLGAQSVSSSAGPLPLAEERRGLATSVFADTDRTPAPKPPAKLLAKVSYGAPLGQNVAYVSPVRRGAKRPGIVWIAGGFDWGIGANAWEQAPRENDQSARALREAGLVLMLPALRGSNENAGKNECFLGEVEDVLAAAEYLSKRKDVDPERIYLGGHSTGGTLALLVAAATSRFAAVFAFGPVADVRQYGADGCLPGDVSEVEARLRAPAQFISSIRTPTFVFEGALGGNVGSFAELRARASERVHFDIVPDVDHFSILAPGTETIARAILDDRVDEAHLLIQP